MSNLFGIDYEKAGKGVPEDGSREGGFLRFFKIIQRKFWAMIRVNLLQVLFSLPAFGFSVLLLSYMYVPVTPDNLDFDFSLRIFIGFMLVSLQVVTTGPLHAGFIYILRNYSREENAFVWSDFIKGIRDNWKRSLAVMIIDLLVAFIVSFTYMFYSTHAGEAGAMSEVSRVILIIIALLYAMMHMYIYPMMVTLDLTVKQLYGNALRFAVAKFLPNLGILAIIVLFGLLLFVNTLAGLFALLLAGYSLTGFLSTFYAYGAIDKYIVQKIKT